jgi:hypothetical protein
LKIIVCIEKFEWEKIKWNILGIIENWTFGNMWLEFIERLLYLMV